MTRPVVIEFRADDGSLIRSMRTTGDQADRLAGQLDNTGGRAENLGRKAEQSAGRMNQLRVAAAATAVVLGAKVYARIADDMATMNARLRLATDGQQEFNQAQSDVTRIANENGRQLGAVAELYTRLSQSLEDYDGKATDVATITQTVTQSMRVSGTSAAESAGAIRQLSQAFASGVLRGDEFNSVNEQAPRIMQALADSLGVTRGELRAMAEQGELTSDVLKRALIDGAQEIADESAQIPRTIGEAFTELGNSVMLLVGAFDTATGSSQNAGEQVANFATRVANAASWINERALSIRLATIAFGESIKLVMAEIGGAFTFAQNIYSQFFAALDNAWNKTVRTAANMAAALVETVASVADFIPDFVPALGGAADSASELGARLRGIAANTRETTLEVEGFGAVWDATRQTVNQAKDEIRATASAQADAAIAAFQSAEAQRELNDEQQKGNERSEEVIKSVQDLARALAAQTERLREEKIERAAGTRGLINYRIAKLAATGATEDEILALQELRDGLLEEQAALDALNDSRRVAIQQAEAQAEAMLRTASAALEAATGIRIFNDENQRAASGGGAGLGGAFSSIGSGFAQSIFNGQSIGDALESAFTGFGGEQLSKSAGQFFDDVASDGLSAAFQNSKTQEGMAGGFALAIGQAVQGNYVQAAFTAAGTAIAGPIGGMIGSIIGGLIGQKSDPNFQIRGTGLQGREFQNIATDEVLTTALGQVEFGFRYIEGGVQSQVMNALEAVDASIAGALRGGSLMEGARAALETFGASSREFDGDLEALLEKRLQAVVRTLDRTVGDMILSASSLEGQLENLQSVMAINRQLLAGASLGLPADFTATTVAPPVTGPGGPGGGPGGPVTGGRFGDTFNQAVDTITDSASGLNSALQSVGEGMDSASVETSGLSPELAATVQALVQVRIANEPLIDTFNRTVQVLNTLDTASALLGARFGETRMEAIAFGADLAALFGDDAGAVAAQFNRVFEAFYTDAEQAEAGAQMAGQEATRLLTALLGELGMEFSESLLTQGGFRELFETLTQMGTLTAAQAAVLLQAGGQVADYIDAQGQLNDTQAEATDLAQQQAEAQAFLNRMHQETLELLAPSWAQYDQLNRAIAENFNQSQSLIDAEVEMTSARRLAHLQQMAFAGELRASIASLTEQFLGTGSDPISQMSSRVQSAATDMGDSIVNGLERVQDWLDGQLLSNTSTLTPQERLNTAQSQFDAAIAAVKAGDFSVLGNLPSLADQLLGEGATFFGTSTDQFGDLESQVRQAMEAIAAIAPPGSNQPPTFAQTANIEAATQSAAQSALEQAQLGTQLIQQVALLARITGESPSVIGEEFGIPISRLIEAVTGELPDATGDALGVYFDDLVGSIDDELSALLDISAAQTAQQATLESIDGSLRRIAGRPEAQAGAGDLVGPVQPGGDSAPIVVDPVQPGGDSAPIVVDPLATSEFDQVLRTENAQIREELRALREELRRIADQTDVGNRDRRQLIVETVGVRETVGATGRSTREAIERSSTRRRGPGG